MEILRKVTLFALAIIASGFSSLYAIRLYGVFFNQGSTFVRLDALAGFPLAYTFFLPLLFTAFGGNKKYWWVGILLIPAAIFEIYFDLSHIYFPVLLGLAGWLIGFPLAKIYRAVFP